LRAQRPQERGEGEREGEREEGEEERGRRGGCREEGFDISGSGSISNYLVISSKQRILHAANTRDFHQSHDLSVGTELKTITPAKAEHPVSY
jgi:hypothetical protein